MKILVCEYEYGEYVSFVCKSVEALADHYIKTEASDAGELVQSQVRDCIMESISLDAEHGAEQSADFDDGSPFIVVHVYDTEKLA